MSDDSPGGANEPFDPDAITAHSPNGQPPGPGWWQASDGNWYPPDAQPGALPPPPVRQPEVPPGEGWWKATDGNWYPPKQIEAPDLGSARASSSRWGPPQDRLASADPLVPQISSESTGKALPTEPQISPEPKRQALPSRPPTAAPFEPSPVLGYSGERARLTKPKGKGRLLAAGLAVLAVGGVAIGLLTTRDRNETSVAGVTEEPADTVANTSSIPTTSTPIVTTTAPTPSTTAKPLSDKELAPVAQLVCDEAAGYETGDNGADGLAWHADCIRVTIADLRAAANPLTVEGSSYPSAPPLTTTTEAPRELTDDQLDQFAEAFVQDRLKPTVIKSFGDINNVDSVDEVTYLPETDQVNIVLTSSYNGEKYHDEDAWEFLQIVAVLWDKEEGAFALGGVKVGLRLRVSSVTYSCNSETMLDIAANRLTKGDVQRQC